MTKTSEHITDAFFFLDERLVFVYLNEAAAQLFGYPKSALVGKSFLETISEKPSFHQQYSKAILQERSFQQESDELVLGRWHRVKVEIEADGLWVSIQDITEFKQARQCTQEQASLLNLAHDNRLIREKMLLDEAMAKVGYCEWDAGQRLLYLSKQVYKIWSLPETTTPELALLKERIYTKDVDMVSKRLYRMQEQKPFELDFRIVWPDQSIHWIHSRWIPEFSRELKLVRLYGTMQDVTKQKASVDQIQQAEKDLLLADQLCKRSNFFNDLVKGSYADEYTLQQLTYYGVDPYVRYCCFALRLTFSGQEEASGLMQRIVGWLFEAAAGWSWRSGADLFCLVPEKMEQCFHKQEQMEYAKNLTEALQEQFPGTQFLVGVSGLSDAPLNLKVLYNKAHSALLVATSLARQEIYHFDELGIYGIAVQLLKGDPLSNGYKTKLEQLYEYDASHDGTLVMTLERILEDENLKVVANKLFIHYNTVLWRKKQIEKVLDLSLDHFETRCLLLLYMRMWKIQKIQME
ncbi:MAG: PAS domain-containing protein [Sporomusaceae bacterium]|nr:PAS domain-containing protein [Sporomusaceae bacterium]